MESGGWRGRIWLMLDRFYTKVAKISNEMWKQEVMHVLIARSDFNKDYEVNGLQMF